ncbi:MAG: uroporphyrinogen-III synthase [Candidatus Acidiferrales bacterium]
MNKASGPLAGKRVVITRAPEQSRALAAALESLGAGVSWLPCVAFAPPEDPKPFDAALLKLAEFDWILFTSQNAVRFFSMRCRELGLPARPIESLQMYRPQVAAVGPATERAAKLEGMRVDYVAKNYAGESLVEELRSSLKGREVLLPRSDRADARVLAALQEAEARLTAVIAYRTLKPQSFDAAILDRISRAEVDLLVFASPSAFQNLSSVTGTGELAALSTRVQFAAVGATTARSLRDAGLQVAIESTEASASGIADAIAEFYQRRPLQARTS